MEAKKPGKKGKVFATQSSMLEIIGIVNTKEDLVTNKKMERMVNLNHFRHETDKY